ncbi:hypothetical protein ACHMXD_07450 [Micrococcus luteus]
MTSPDPTASTPSSPTPSRQRRAKIVVWVLLGLVVAAALIGYLVARGTATAQQQDPNQSTAPVHRAVDWVCRSVGAGE